MRKLGTALFALTLAACAIVDQPRWPSAESVVDETAVDEVHATVGDQGDPPVPSDKPEAPDVPEVPLASLVGVEDAEVLAMLGEPDLREDRAPGVAWIYEGVGCRFGLLLYPDLETNRRTVLSFETEDGEPCAARIATP